MNTAGGNDAKHEWEKWLDALKEQAARDGASLRDPSVRDVLAQLDRIETMIGALNEQVGALNARMDELTLKVKRVTS